MAGVDAAGTSHRAGDLRRAAAPMHEPAMVSAQPVAGGLGGATGSRGAVRCLTGGRGGGGWMFDGRAWVTVNRSAQVLDFGRLSLLLLESKTETRDGSG